MLMMYINRELMLACPKSFWVGANSCILMSALRFKDITPHTGLRAVAVGLLFI